MEPALSLIVVALAAFALPLLAGRLRVPAVVAEILFGILAGPSLLDLVEPSEALSFLAEFGFLLLMFLSGFEIDFEQLRRGGVLEIATGLVLFAATLYLAWWCAAWLGQGPFVTLLLATTSVGLVVPTLRDTRRIQTPLGQTILVAALLADFLTLLAVALFALVHERGVGWHLARFPGLFALFLVISFAFRRIVWWFPERFQRLFAENDPDEIGIRTSLAWMFVFVGLSYLFGIEAILGAFLAGSVFALVFRNPRVLEQKLKGFAYGFFIPIFFIHVGTQFDVAALRNPAVFQGALALCAAAAGVKLLPALLLALRGFSFREALAAGTLLSARLSLIIAVATLGARLGFLDRVVESQVILLAVVTSTSAPAIFRLLLPRAKSGRAAAAGAEAEAL